MTTDAPAASLANAQGVTTLGDPAALATLLAAVRDLARDAGDFTLERLQSLTGAGEHFESLLASESLAFLAATGPFDEARRDFAAGVQRVWLELANGFQRFLRHRNAWATTRNHLEAMYRVTGLAVHGIHQVMKWGYYLNEPGRMAPWKPLHALFSLAETERYAQVPFTLHSSRSAFRPSVQSLYLATLVLDLLHRGELSRMQIEIADGWLAAWCEDYNLDSEYSSRHHTYCVDVSANAGLRTITKESHAQSARYLRADGLKAQIDDVVSGLDEGRRYAGDGLGAAVALEEHRKLVPLVQRFCESMRARSENRLEERVALEDHEVDVAVGVDRVLHKCREAPVPAPARTSSSDPDVERWRVHDLSARGFGLAAEANAGESVLLNGLIALRNQATGGWIAGSVARKVANRVRGETKIGVEILSYRPIPIELAPVRGGAAAPALYLPAIDGLASGDTILMRAADFSSEHSFAARVGGAEYHLRFHRIDRKGADWVSARFEIESRA